MNGVQVAAGSNPAAPTISHRLLAHSIAPIHPELIVGRTMTAAEEPLVCQALAGGRSLRGNRTLIPDGAPLLQEVHPVRNEKGKVLGVLSIKTNLIEHKRHRRRNGLQITGRRLLYEFAPCT